MATSLQGTTVLVTGAGGGLGKVIATAYLEAGANVAICDIHEERLAAARSELEGTGRFAAFNTDVTSEEAVAKLVGDVAARFGRLDILVSNAGMTDKFDPVGAVSKETWDRIIGLNLTGSFLAFKAAVNAMEKQSPPGGTIIQIGSTASYHGMSSGVAYAASKHGVAALVKSTAGYYGAQGIFAIGLLLGGMVDTNIQDGFAALGGFNTEAFAQSAAAGFKPEMAVKTADVAKYCVFLADRGIAESSNGSLIRFNKNLPVA
ncbi:NAD(P)-binding protein [Daldinia caldariorum]|uniref:NAD(P)-binding protein n=1 Tax=Daldinia caldariorum TaxID=326644 RepID=UPI002007DBBC|nr:NAD(P)-binding protein [Daldinia caldariorum]KAI1463605.1 NAD(P)-binding protein [Daldinia caldariorum]